MLAEAKQKMLASTQEASYQPKAAGDVTDSRRKRSDSRERKMQRIWSQVRRTDRSGSREESRERSGSREGRKEGNQNREKSESRERRNKRSGSRERKDRTRSRERRRERSGSRERRRERSRSRERWKKRSRGRERDQKLKFMKPNQEEAIRGSAEFKPRCFDDDGDSGRRNFGFVRPSESNNQPNEKGGTGLLLQDPKRNMKPKENARNKNYQTSESYKPRWKKNNEEEKMRERNRKPCSGLEPRKEDDEKTGGSTENFHQKEDKYYIRDPKGLHWKENQDKTQKIHEKRKNSSSDSSSGKVLNAIICHVWCV